MLSEPLKPPTLRRSCQACIRGKRRCDQRWPRCSRCISRKVDCEYTNVPLTAGSNPPAPAAHRRSHTRQMAHIPAPEIPRPLHLEIAKGYEQGIIRFLVEGMREFPIAFAENMKTLFIHPDLYESSVPPTPIQDIHVLCRLHVQATQEENSHILVPILRQKTTQLNRQLSRASSFEEQLGCAQALILAQCILILNEDGNDQDAYSETVSIMLSELAGRLWRQAPIQLPHTLSPRRAWLFAESVRRTIIVGFMLRSVYSLKKRNYSVRTPFVDSLPFDVRTSLWDDESNDTWSGVASDGCNSMVSLHEYSSMLENGLVYGVSPFSALILAACKGKPASRIPFPPVTEYEVY